MKVIYFAMGDFRLKAKFSRTRESKLPNWWSKTKVKPCQKHLSNKNGMLNANEMEKCPGEKCGCLCVTGEM